MDKNDKKDWTYRDYLAKDLQALIALQKNTKAYEALLRAYVDEIFGQNFNNTDVGTVVNEIPFDRHGWNWQKYLENSPLSLLKMEKDKSSSDYWAFLHILQEHAKSWLGKAPEMPEKSVAAHYEYLWKFKSNELRNIKNNEPQRFEKMLAAFNNSIKAKVTNNEEFYPQEFDPNNPNPQYSETPAPPPAAHAPAGSQPASDPWQNADYEEMYKNVPHLLEQLKKDNNPLFLKLERDFRKKCADKLLGKGLITKQDYNTMDGLPQM